MWILWVGVILCSSSYTMSVPFLPLFLFELGVDKASVNTLAVRSTGDEFRGRSFGLTTSSNQLGANDRTVDRRRIRALLNIHWIFVTTGIILAGAGLTVMSRT